MKSILAIDPAWTLNEPSGFALLTGDEAGWRCVGLAPSYAQFLALAGGSSVEWSTSPTGGLPDVGGLLAASQGLLDGGLVDLVAIDMPVSTKVISGRRAADSAISCEFGGRGCSTHSPNAIRPGSISDTLSTEFEQFGYPIGTTKTRVGTTPVLIEVYPHPALLVLMDASYRVPYKVSRVGRYWPKLTPPARRRRLVEEWTEIRGSLARTIFGADIPLPPADAATQLRMSDLKRYEDSLDALICGWIGIQYLQERCTPYGDDTSAIWTP